jgi:hypothetical protein|uniref:helix-turn-helix domain-containing protein n=1 Tax=Parabacteroides merdae TaxID=46503 RepID=UPI003FEE439F
MQPPALEMSGFRRSQRNFAPTITATLRIMEVVIIERKAFEALMTDVSSLTEKVNRLCGREKDRRMAKWMDNEEVCRLLRLTPRTLQTMRDKGLIACSQIGKKFYYRREDVANLVADSRETSL